MLPGQASHWSWMSASREASFKLLRSPSQAPAHFSSLSLQVQGCSSLLTSSEADLRLLLWWEAACCCTVAKAGLHVIRER